MQCNHCGSPVDDHSKFCPQCGEAVQGQTEAAASSPTPGHPEVQFTPVKRKRTGLWIGVGAAVVVVGLGSAAAAVTKPFTSPKQLLLEAATQQQPGALQSTEETLHLSLKDINVPGLPQPEAGIITTLKGSTIDFNLLFAPESKQAQVDFTTQYQSVAHKGSLWLSSDSAVLSAADYQSLLAMAQPGIKLPQYLKTDASQADAIKQFWSELEKSPKQLTDGQATAVRDLETMLINAIPDKYVHRSGLASIKIDFDQAGLQDILKSEVSAVYANKDKFADDVSQLASGASLPNGMTSADIKTQLLDGLNQAPEEMILGAVSSVFNSGALSLQPTELVFNKTLFGKGFSEHMTGGLTVKGPVSGVGATVEYTLDAHTPASHTITMPSVTSGNSQTFTDWVMQQGQ